MKKEKLWLISWINREGMNCAGNFSAETADEAVKEAYRIIQNLSAITNVQEVR